MGTAKCTYLPLEIISKCRFNDVFFLFLQHSHWQERAYASSTFRLASYVAGFLQSTIWVSTPSPKEHVLLQPSDWQVTLQTCSCTLNILYTRPMLFQLSTSMSLSHVKRVERNHQWHFSLPKDDQACYHFPVFNYIVHCSQSDSSWNVDTVPFGSTCPMQFHTYKKRSSSRISDGKQGSFNTFRQCIKNLYDTFGSIHLTVTVP